MSATRWMIKRREGGRYLELLRRCRRGYSLLVGARFWSGYAGDGLLLLWKGFALLAGAPVCFVDEGGLQPFVYQAMPFGVGALCYKLCYKSDPGPTGLLVGGGSDGEGCLGVFRRCGWGTSRGGGPVLEWVCW